MKIIIRISSILFGILFALLLLELFLRLFDTNSAAWTGPDDLLGYSFIPNAYYKFDPPEGCTGWGSEGRINSHGLRDFEYDYQKQKGTFRILALGDSFTEAMQFPLEVGWTKQLEKRLNERGEKLHYEVINAGIGGFGTAQEYLLFINEGYRYSPDLVILMFYSNDVIDNSKVLTFQQSIPFYSIVNNELILDNSFKQSNAYRLKALLEPIKPKSYLISFLARVYNQVSRINNQRNIEAKNADGSDGANGMEWTRVESDKAIEVTNRLLIELNQAVLNSGAKMVIFNIDENVTVIPDQPNKMLSEVAGSQGIPYNDLYPVLVPGLEKNIQSAGEFMFGCAENDGGGHLSQAGNIKTAKLIYEYLLYQKLLF